MSISVKAERILVLLKAIKEEWFTLMSQPVAKW
jgi:hypothetical protein